MLRKDFSECHKSYVLLSEAWYNHPGLRGPDVVDEVCFGYQHRGGGSPGELVMQWVNLGFDRPTPRLTAFNDAWAALATFKDVIDAMAEVDSQRITPHEFCAILDRCGFVDETPREDPEKQR